MKTLTTTLVIAIATLLTACQTEAPKKDCCKASADKGCCAPKAAASCCDKPGETHAH